MSEKQFGGGGGGGAYLPSGLFDRSLCQALETQCTGGNEHSITALRLQLAELLWLFPPSPEAIHPTPPSSQSVSQTGPELRFHMRGCF